MTKRRIDGYLSRKAQVAHPDCLVYCEEGGPVEVWTLTRPGEPAIGLGGSFGSAKQAVDAMVSAAKNGKDKV